MSDRPITPRNMGDTDAPHMSPVTPSEDVRTIMLNRVSWSAVLAGVVVSLVAQLLLNMLGVGVGAATIDPGTADNPAASTFSIVAALWWTISGIIAAFCGGYAAGRLSGKPKEGTAGWHGIVTWALTTLVIFYLLTTTIGGIIGGLYSTVSNAVGGVAQTAATAAAPAMAGAADPFQSIENSIRATTGSQDPGAVTDAAVAAVRGALSGDPAQAEQARAQAADALARAQGIPVEQARAQVDQYGQQVEQAKQQATEAADTAASAVSTGAIFGFIALVLGAVASWFGGRSGTVEPTITSRLMSRTNRV
jgi:hypothetical protein